ncbi:MAG: hypothetical protein IJ649_04995, partial [Oscillospiraceae bacterium]|nr:hypothetical protein [Oscillospiraceae bacterium]
SVADMMVNEPIRFTVSFDSVEDVEEVEERPFLHFFKRKVKVKVPKTVEREREFIIKPPKLGKMQVLSRFFLDLQLDEKALEETPVTEAMRVCNEKTDIVCALMAAAVCNTQDELTDADYQKALAAFFKENGDEEKFAILLLALLSQQNYSNFIASIRLMKTFRLNKPTGRQGADLVELSEDAPSGVAS